MKSLDNLLKADISTWDLPSMNSSKLSETLVDRIQKYGKISKAPRKQAQQWTEEEVVGVQHLNNDVHSRIDKVNAEKWKFINECTDSKHLWNSINMRGEVKPDLHDDIPVESIASFCARRSKIDISQTLYDGITTNTENHELDKEVDNEEIEEALTDLNQNSKTNDGITPNTVKFILPTIITILISLFNLILKGGPEAYPANWLNFINAIPKKGRLQLPKFLRCISIMGVFEKLYQTILNKRLYKFLKIPHAQTAYQKSKGCNIHVMTIRLLKILTVKTKQKLFIIFTDFEAAFDLVSRRLLFEKLVKLGISTIMLNALISIYIASQSVVEHKGEFSDYVILLCGIKQGAPPSGILYIAYTLDIITMYNNEFNPEPLLYLVHLPMHVDDILLLATSKSLAIQKLRALITYCQRNYIKLQLAKCAVLCVNSSEIDDHLPITVDGVVLENKKEEVYLGSVITNSRRLIDDVEADIRKRQVNVIKFYAFLRSNSNAPVDVKTKVLQACTVTSILHNAETWANAKVERLEVAYRKMMKSIIGVKVTTCSEFMYIELDLPSIRTQIMMKQWSFWTKVLEMSKECPLHHAITLAKHFKLKEIEHYEQLVTSFNSKDEIREKFMEENRKSIRVKAERGKSKYIKYLQVNPSLGTPKIYKSVNRHSDVSMVAGLRTSSHNLQIEMGRRTRTPREDRKCLCGEVEDEDHFALSCDLYADIRRKHNVLTSTEISCMFDNDRHVEYLNELYKRRKELK